MIVGDAAVAHDIAGAVIIIIEGRPEPPEIGTRATCLLTVFGRFICHAISICSVGHIFCIQQKDLFSG